jgi:hypothetical protein
MLYGGKLPVVGWQVVIVFKHILQAFSSVLAA